ncbi:hypothetical protein H4R18_002480 [Coemansia javaensis]|uniref:Uncharacterized protein n=1 Tax=Coemansia javaensis TaxID=2761396 RepID=A0A9W8HC09_9FUNG|nr:hypothetical protein H4R18_002480 [Coemansia javaensis]
MAKDCGDERDWLTARPSRVVGWVLGALAVLVGVALAVLTCKWCSLPFFDAVLAMAELAVSLFLRAALGMDLGNSDMVYKASMVFSYHAGIQVACLLSVLAIHMHLHFHPEALSRRVLALTVSRVLSVCLAAMVIVGVALMFDERVPFAGTGIRLIQVSMFAIVLACIVLGAAVMRTSKCTAADYYHRHYAAFGTLLFFLALWAAFMGVRTLVPLQSPARDTRHEAVFYILGYGPLLIAGAAMVILKAPLLFNFDLASRWHKR